MGILKKRLDAELAKYETWEKWKRSATSCSPLWNDKGNFIKSKNSGVGRIAILRFLGPEYESHKGAVEQALAALRDIREGEKQAPRMDRPISYLERGPL